MIFVILALKKFKDEQKPTPNCGQHQFKVSGAVPEYLPCRLTTDRNVNGTYISS